MTKQPKRMSARRNKNTSGTSENLRPARKKHLTLKQRQFISNKIAGQSGATAARNAGYSESVAAHADRIITSAVQAAFRDMLHAAGLSDETLVTRIEEGLNATIVSKATAHADREVLVDFSERREMVELALRLTGRLTNKHEIGIGGPDGEPVNKIVVEVEYVNPTCEVCGAEGPYGATKRCEKCESLPEQTAQE